MSAVFSILNILPRHRPALLCHRSAVMPLPVSMPVLQWFSVSTEGKQCFELVHNVNMSEHTQLQSYRQCTCFSKKKQPTNAKKVLAWMRPEAHQVQRRRLIVFSEWTVSMYELLNGTISLFKDSLDFYHKIIYKCSRSLTQTRFHTYT